MQRLMPVRNQRVNPTARWTLRVLCSALLLSSMASCDNSSSAGPAPPEPGPIGDGANLQLVGVQITQGAQDAAGSLPMIAGQPAVVNVLIARSKESVAEVPVVLRLFRNGVLIRSDTASTGGILSRATSDAAPSAQFLIPGSLIGTPLSWQVEVDPARSNPDSTRTDNLLPGPTAAPISIVPIPSIALRLLPVILGNHDGAAGDVSSANIDRYLQTVRRTLPVGAVEASVAPALTTMTNFGTPPTGGAPNFWQHVLQEIDVARIVSGQPSAYWYGVVTAPTGYTTFTNGGYGYIPGSATDIGGGTRSAVGFGISPASNFDFVSKTLAHELGHQLGRAHAPSCGAASPLDAAFPDGQGTILQTGHDVWSWATGVTRGALSVSRATGDVMGYCSAVWASPYTWGAVLRWRQTSTGVVTQVRAEPAVIVAGAVSATGDVTLRPALDAIVVVPPADASGDMSIELQTAAGSVLARQQVVSRRVEHGDGERHFVAILPASNSASASVIAATSRTTGRSVSLRASSGSMDVQIRSLAGGRTEVRAAPGRAVMLRDAQTGDLLSIGWDGRVIVRHPGAMTVTVSDGIRSRSTSVAPR